MPLLWLQGLSSSLFIPVFIVLPLRIRPKLNATLERIGKQKTIERVFSRGPAASRTGPLHIIQQGLSKYSPAKSSGPEN
jgi:hypothetical protein